MNEIVINNCYKDFIKNKKLEKTRSYFEIQKNSSEELLLYPKACFPPSWRDFDSFSIYSPRLSYDLYENKNYGKPQLWINISINGSLKTKLLNDYNSWKKIIKYFKTLTKSLPIDTEPPLYFDF